MVRVFVAVPISAGLQAEIFNWRKRLKNLPVRWLDGENLHITLVPPWYAEENDIPKLGELLGETAKGKKVFRVIFRNVSFGPDSKRPRLIWADGDAVPAASRLKEDAEKLFGVKSEYRPWKMHLTIARFKEEDFAGFPLKKLDEKVSWEMEASSVVLMQSHLSPQGADYEVLKEIKLGDG